MMYKIYDVSGNTMNLVYAYTNCLPIGMDLLLRQLTFLMNCRWINNYVVKFVFEYFGHHDVYDMTVFTSLAFPTWTCSVVGVCQGCCAGLCHLWCNCQLFWVVHWTAQVDSCAAGAAVLCGVSDGFCGGQSTSASGVTGLSTKFTRYICIFVHALHLHVCVTVFKNFIFISFTFCMLPILVVNKGSQ